MNSPRPEMAFPGLCHLIQVITSGVIWIKAKITGSIDIYEISIISKPQNQTKQNSVLVNKSNPAKTKILKEDTPINP